MTNFSLLGSEKVKICDAFYNLDAVDFLSLLIKAYGKRTSSFLARDRNLGACQCLNNNKQ